jgi:hypothetical protein
MKRLAAGVGVAMSVMAGAAYAVPGNYDIIQTQTFSDSFSGFTSNGGLGSSGTYQAPTYRSATINGFGSYSTGSGSLNSVTIRWNNTSSFSGTTGSSGGNASVSGGGSVYVNSILYNGMGSGNSSGNAPGLIFSFTADWNGSTPADYVFTFADANVTYDPAIWATFIGSNTFTVSEALSAALYNINLAYSGIVSGQFNANSEVIVTYSYFGEQVPVSLPATAALLGFGLVGIGAARRKQA